MTITIEGKDFWQQQLENLKTSGLTRSQYCRENNINYDRFGYWLKRLSSASSEFVPVKLHAPEPASPHSALCTLELRGHILKIHDFSALSFVIERFA
jgi:hypothetical protein